MHTPILISEDNCNFLNNVRPIYWSNPKPPNDFVYDLAIIGASNRAISIAMHASRKGLKVAMIEKRFLGGKYWNSTNYPLNFLIEYCR